MKKNIIIGILALLVIFLVLFSLTKNIQLYQARELEKESIQRAAEAEDRVIELEGIAIRNQMEADRQRQIAEECASKK